MRMISITDTFGRTTLINPNQITKIWQDSEAIIITLSCGGHTRTKFTTIDHALDYIQRASSHSLIGG